MDPTTDATVTEADMRRAAFLAEHGPPTGGDRVIAAHGLRLTLAYLAGRSGAWAETAAGFLRLQLAELERPAAA